MKIIAGQRLAGKTFRMLEWLREDKSRILVVHSQQEKRRLTMGLNSILIPQILTFDEITKGNLQGVRNKHIAIDNLDWILQRIFPDQVIELLTFNTTQVETL